MKPENQPISTPFAKRLNFTMRGRAVAAAITAALLTGCAQLPPMVEQLKTEKKTHIVLLVENGPFQYTVPAAMDATGGGIPIIMLIGALAAVSVQHSLEGANAKLATAASEKGVNNDHRQAFVGGLVRRLNHLGFTVDVVPVGYASSSLGKDRRFYLPVLNDVPLSDGVPAFALNLDVGSCTFGVISPCIRYALQAIQKPSMTPPSSESGRGGRGGSGSSPSGAQIVRYRGAAGTISDSSTPSASELKKFSTVDDAVANVAEFDGALARLVPVAVNQLAESLEALPVR